MSSPTRDQHNVAYLNNQGMPAGHSACTMPPASRFCATGEQPADIGRLLHVQHPRPQLQPSNSNICCL